MSLETKDPTVAVVIERLARLTDDFAEFREEIKESLHETKSEMKADIEAVRADLKTTQESVGGLNLILSNGRFLWVALSFLGGGLLWTIGSWEKVSAIFHALIK